MNCQACGVRAETRYVEFHQNIGVLILRFSKAAKGNLCKSCINRYFWEFTTINMLFGWWGIISFFLNIIFIANNVIRYLSCLSMAPVGHGTRERDMPGPHADGVGATSDSCRYCGRADADLERRGYCMSCNRDV